MPKRKSSGGGGGGVRTKVLAVMAAGTLWLSASQYDHHMSCIGDKTAHYDLMIAGLGDTAEFDTLVNEPIDNNPSLYRCLKGFTLSVSHAEDSPAGRAKRDSKVIFVFSLIIDMLIRLLNDKVWCYSIMLLTLQAVRANANTTFWSTLVKCKVLYSKKTGTEVAQDLGRKKLSLRPGWASKVAGIAVFDNCAYSLRSNHEHVDESRRTLFYQTINWFYTFAIGRHDDELLEDGELVGLELRQGFWSLLMPKSYWGAGPLGAGYGMQC